MAEEYKQLKESLHELWGEMESGKVDMGDVVKSLGSLSEYHKDFGTVMSIEHFRASRKKCGVKFADGNAS